MTWNRRQILRTAAAAGAAFTGASCGAPAESKSDPIQNLQPMTQGVTPISDDERRGRIEKARRLMAENKIDALYLEAGSSLFYYTGITWSRTERMFAMVLPREGEPVYVAPGFEEERAREQIRFGDDIRRWEEDESPYKVVAGIFKDHGIRTGRIGFEETVRFFLFDGVRKEAPALEYVDATAVTAGCRMIKSPAEIALMQKANDVTIEAFKATVAGLHEGMTPAEFRANCAAAHQALGFSGGVMVNFGKYSAFPHGSTLLQNLRNGDIIIMDGGCSVEGYRSDITRTLVFGDPSDRQREIWNIERKAQDAAFAAAQVGATCESVDAAARKVITDAGFGPDYKVPGLPHRTGHGIGLDGHEWTNFVRGNTTKIEPGMCFSDEPMLTIYGEFGVRLEDCLYVTEDGPRMFTRQSPFIEQPFG